MAAREPIVFYLSLVSHLHSSFSAFPILYFHPVNGLPWLR